MFKGSLKRLLQGFLVSTSLSFFIPSFAENEPTPSTLLPAEEKQAALTEEPKKAPEPAKAKKEEKPSSKKTATSAHPKKIGGGIKELQSLIAGSPLEKTLTDAYKNNTEIQDQRARVRATDETVPQALAGWRPTVTVQGQLQSQKQIRSGDQKIGKDSNLGLIAQTGGLTNTAQGTINLNQNIYSGGETIAKTNVAESNVRASRSQLLVVEQRVLLNAIQAYLDLFAKSAQIELLKSNENVLQKTLEATQDKFKVGEETRTSVAQAEAQLDDAKAKRQTAEAELEGLKATYIRLTGKAPDTIQKPRELSILPSTLEGALEMAKNTNPTIKAALFESDAARHAIDQARAGLLPKLDLQGSLNRSYTKTRTDYQNLTLGTEPSQNSYNRTTQQSVALTLSVPIYEAGFVRSQIRQAHAMSEQKRVAVETARRQIVEQLIQAWENYLASKANIENYRSQVKSNKISLEGTRQEMLVGSKILLDVLNAQSKLLEAQLNLVSAERAFYLAGFQLLGAMGLLTAKTLGLKVNYYDPETYYNDVRNSW